LVLSAEQIIWRGVLGVRCAALGNCWQPHIAEGDV